MRFLLMAVPLTVATVTPFAADVAVFGLRSRLQPARASKDATLAIAIPDFIDLIPRASGG
jgi:hypothetical protein